MNWESLIAERIAAHRDTYAPQRIEDAGKRNSRSYQLKWKHEHRDRENERRRKWEQANPDKVREYREKAKPAIKRWAEEHPERRREINRKSDAKRRNSTTRKAWRAAYVQNPEYKERRRELDRKRNATPERKAYERARYQRRQAARLAAQKEVA